MPIAERFFETPQSRFLVTNLDSETVTFLDRLASNRKCVHTLNEPFELSMELPSDNPEVNLPALSSDPTQPFVDEGLNLVYWFLRYGNTLSTSSGPWECVGASIILNIEDGADTDGAPVTRVVGKDSWAMLYKAPVLDEDGVIRDPIHFVTGTRASDIAFALLTRVATFRPNFDAHLLVDVANKVDTEPLADPMEFQAGTTIGEAFDELVRTGTIDIYMRPMYEPVTNPGKICYIETGVPEDSVTKYEAIFGWDRWPRNLVRINREQDGEARANYIKYYAGDAGLPVDPFFNTSSIAMFGEYWEMQAFPDKTREVIVEKMAARELALRGKGQLSYVLSAAAERSPLVFKEYHIGQNVRVFASKRLRRPIENEIMRVQSIPVEIDDDQLARVTDIQVSADVEIGT